MLIQSGRVGELDPLPWVAIELTSESRIDETVLRLVRWSMKRLETFQLLYPIESRGLRQPSLLSPYLWMRVPTVAALDDMTALMGIQGMVSDADGHPVLVEPPFVLSLIEKTRAAQASWSNGIACGSGVRILLGSGHGLCGVVEHLRDSTATIRVALRSRAIRLDVPVRALRNLGAAPSDYFVKEED